MEFSPTKRVGAQTVLAMLIGGGGGGGQNSFGVIARFVVIGSF